MQSRFSVGLESCVAICLCKTNAYSITIRLCRKCADVMCVLSWDGCMHIIFPSIKSHPKTILQSAGLQHLVLI